MDDWFFIKKHDHVTQTFRCGGFEPEDERGAIDNPLVLEGFGECPGPATICMSFGSLAMGLCVFSVAMAVGGGQRAAVLQSRTHNVGSLNCNSELAARVHCLFRPR